MPPEAPVTIATLLVMVVMIHLQWGTDDRH
jgi:hypothetical protein